LKSFIHNIIWLIFLSFSLELCAQYHVRGHIGALYYQGDLAPKPIDLSFGPGNLAVGISAGRDLTDWCSINFRHFRGRISGDDAFSENTDRRLRNLSFTSPLYEYGLYTDLKINKLWKGMDKYGLKMYVTVGYNYVHFDPHTLYQGEWVRLQPLGTEGQNLPESKIKPYSLYTWTRILGGIIEFDVTSKWSVGLEASPRKSYTDYLDDVSTTYANYDEMVSAGNQLGAALTNRMGEYLNSGPVKMNAGSPRGRSDKNDWYTHFGIYVKFHFGKKVINYNLPDDSISKEEFLNVNN
jgi:hypothetical protein